MKDTNMDNRVCLFYIADRLMELAEVKDKDLRKYVVEFREECLRNLGVNALHDHNNQEKEMSIKFTDWIITMQEDAEEMEYLEFISKHGEVNADIWRDYHNPNYADHEQG